MVSFAAALKEAEKHHFKRVGSVGLRLHGQQLLGRGKSVQTDGWSRVHRLPLRHGGKVSPPQP